MAESSQPGMRTSSRSKMHRSNDPGRHVARQQRRQQRTGDCFTMILCSLIGFRGVVQEVGCNKETTGPCVFDLTSWCKEQSLKIETNAGD